MNRRKITNIALVVLSLAVIAGSWTAFRRLPVPDSVAFLEFPEHGSASAAHIESRLRKVKGVSVVELKHSPGCVVIGYDSALTGPAAIQNAAGGCAVCEVMSTKEYRNRTGKEICLQLGSGCDRCATGGGGCGN